MAKKAPQTGGAHSPHLHGAGEWCFSGTPLTSANALEVAALPKSQLLASIRAHEADFKSQLASLPEDLRKLVLTAATAAGWKL
jgi:hypothetical protein